MPGAVAHIPLYHYKGICACKFMNCNTILDILQLMNLQAAYLRELKTDRCFIRNAQIKVTTKCHLAAVCSSV